MIDYLLCADWSKHHKGRALYAANVQSRELFRIEGARLTVHSALEKARDLAERKNVLLSFDFPLGLPQSFFSAIRNAPHWEAPSDFIEFLPMATRTPSFFISGCDASAWSVSKPFFAVPSGPGAKKAFEAKAARQGIQLRRVIERVTRGNTVFITSGIPGSVGSGTIDAWIELASLLPLERDFKVWPFEGSLSNLFASTRIVIAENYPRAIYAAALSDVISGKRSLLQISKTRAHIRKAALECLRSRSWIIQHAVKLKNTNAALADENSFDALLTTAGLLRILLDEEQLSCSKFEDSVAEGGILGTGTINFDLPQKKFLSSGPNKTSPGRAKTSRNGIVSRATLNVDSDGKISKENESVESTYACPIPTCSKRFIGGRGGWDGHVGSLRNHRDWHPAVTGYKDRVELFRIEFPLFFS